MPQTATLTPLPLPRERIQHLELLTRGLAGADGIARCNRVRKVEPMQRALDELGVGTWISNIRRSQSVRDEDTRFFGLQRECGLYFAATK